MELRLVLTVDDFERALAFYADALGLDRLEMWTEAGARGALLGAGRATLELIDEQQAAAIDEIEVGRRVAGRVRVAFEVEDSDATAQMLVAAGATQLAKPVTTPWNHRNVRLQAPDGMQLTLFTVVD
jgi:catechol 2,3-dioxygenase-like lactoylglutathione lyase family enzyme